MKKCNPKNDIWTFDEYSLLRDTILSVQALCLVVCTENDLVCDIIAIYMSVFMRVLVKVIKIIAKTWKYFP